MSTIVELLVAHRFNKGLGQCKCGWQHEPRGHREEQHRAHLAALLVDVFNDTLAAHAFQGFDWRAECRCGWFEEGTPFPEEDHRTHVLAVVA